MSSTGQRSEDGRPTECRGGMTDPIYHGLATGLCPCCDEFVALVNTGQTVRHFGRQLQ